MDFPQFHKLIAGTRLEPLGNYLQPEFIRGLNNGNLEDWLEAIAGAPAVAQARVEIESQVSLDCEPALSPADFRALDDSLKALIPWRKGPFQVFGTFVDTEWRSDIKWDRVIRKISPLRDRLVLDVGCGNGYYCLRMLGAGARQVVGLDPHLAYVVQFWLLKRYLEDYPADVLPIGLEQLPEKLAAFDTTFSMGVLYHRRSPIEHLEQLRDTLVPGGQLVLETIVVDGELGYSLTPMGRYAGMRNVWFIPSISTTIRWLEKTGFVDIDVVDISTTTSLEQRGTDWMPFRSLSDSLNPEDAALTIEGYPAPKRAVLIANRKS